MGTYTVFAVVEHEQDRPQQQRGAERPEEDGDLLELGVLPTRNPVFRSCEVVPPLDAAMQTIAPTDSAVT